MKQKKETLSQVISFLIINSILTTIVFVFMLNGYAENMGWGVLMMSLPGISAIVTSIIHKDKIRDYGWNIL